MDRRSFIKSSMIAFPFGLTMPPTAEAGRRRRRRCDRQERSTSTYYVRHETLEVPDSDDVPDGGTDEFVAIWLEDSYQHNIITRILDNPGNDRIEGAIDEYTFTAPTIGHIYRIGLKLIKRGASGANMEWRCGEVYVENTTTRVTAVIPDFGYLGRFNHWYFEYPR